MSETVLLVEDNEEIAAINEEAFKMDGFETMKAFTLAQAREILQKKTIDLIVLDIMLPDGSGLDFCAEVRKESQVPILFLTGLDDKEQIIQGIQVGGDDYLTKPYNLHELVVRATGLIRRSTWAHDGNRKRVYGGLVLDMRAIRATIHGEDIHLSTREFALLAYLLDYKGQYINEERLCDAVWGGGHSESDKVSTVRVYILKLRKKLCGRADITITIENEYKLGYRIWV